MGLPDGIAERTRCTEVSTFISGEAPMLNRNSLVALAAISTLSTVALAPTSASAMRGGFDGDWSVVIMTQRGACSTGVRFGVDIRNGVFYSSGSFDIQGRVTG